MKITVSYYFVVDQRLDFAGIIALFSLTVCPILLSLSLPCCLPMGSLLNMCNKNDVGIKHNMCTLHCLCLSMYGSVNHVLCNCIFKFPLYFFS